MTDENTAGKRKGCGPVLVFMIAVFAMTFGLLVGAGGLYAYLYFTDDGVERLNIAEIAEAPPAAPQTDEPADDDDVYAMAYPLLDSINVHASLDEDTIRNHISENRELLQKCYEEELERAPGTRGEVDIQFSIRGNNGEVATAVIRNNRTGSEQLGRCLTRAIQDEWSFSAPDTPGVATVRFQSLFFPLRPE